MLKYLVLLVLSLPLCLSAQNSVFGVWKAIDDTDGEATSYIEIYDQNGKLHGKIIKLLREEEDIVCGRCKGEKKDKPVLGMEIIWDMEQKGAVWKGGNILDPEAGKDYKCRITLENDILQVRGYIGMPALGRTQQWQRVK